MRIGTAKRIVTPTFTVDLSGFAARQQPATGIHDDICVRSIVLDDGNRRVAISSIEALGFDLEHIQRLRAGLAEEAYKAEELVFCCSHTHGAPAVQRLRLCGTPSQEFVNSLISSLIECVLEAGKATQECEVFIGSAKCELGWNRRGHHPDNLQPGETASTETDHELVTLQFRAMDGQPISTIFNYACHAVILGGDNRLITGDWPGEVSRRLEDSGSGLTLFVQGCCGDTNPRIRGSYEIRDEAAEMVTESVAKALENAQRVVKPSLEARIQEVTLPLQPNPPDSELQARLVEINAKPTESRTYDDLRDLAWCSAVIAAKEAARQTELPIQVGEVNIGAATIAWLPAEAFCSYGKKLKAARTQGKTLVAGYTNGNIGYLPTRAAYEKGGYEVASAYRYYGGYQMISQDSEKLVLSAFGVEPKE